MLPEIDGIVHHHVDAQGPGLALGIVRNAAVVHSAGYGFANLEWQTPVAPTTVFGLGSITKQFTATAIMLLHRQGQLHVDDPLTTYLPDYPTAGHDIRVHHLLTHTSGIRSVTSLPGYFDDAVRRDMTPTQLCDLFKQEPFDFAPGEAFRYNNSGYILLGLLIERVSGLPYDVFLQQHIFDPLGMRQTYYLHNQAIIPHRAGGYVTTEHGFENAPYVSMTHPYAAGALGSTVDDLIRWDQALTEHRLLDPADMKQMYHAVHLNNKQTADYGFGWRLGSYHGHRLIHHSGGLPGFESWLARFVDDRVTIMLLANRSPLDLAPLLRQISRAVLAIPPITREPISVDAATLAKVVGVYRETPTSGAVAEATQEGARLRMREGAESYVLMPTSPTTFYRDDDPEVEVQFTDEHDGHYHKAVFTFPLRDPWEVVRSATYDLG